VHPPHDASSDFKTASLAVPDIGQGRAHKKPPSPICLRLTPAEREQLVQDANGKPISAYIRSRLFADSQRSRSIRAPQRDQRLLSQILALIGQLEMAASMRDLADAAQLGTVDVSPEMEIRLHKTCEQISQIRTLLIQALGLIERPNT
jgi:hypothetical protein